MLLSFLLLRKRLRKGIFMKKKILSILLIFTMAMGLTIKSSAAELLTVKEVDFNFMDQIMASDGLCGWGVIGKNSILGFGDNLDVHIYDFSGNEKSNNTTLEKYLGYGNSWNTIDENINLITVGDNQSGAIFYFFDKNGNVCSSYYADANYLDSIVSGISYCFFRNGFPHGRITSNNNIIEIYYTDYNSKEETHLFYFYEDAVLTGNATPVLTVDISDTTEYDENLWSYYEKSKYTGYTFVGTADESQWGYLDANGNVLKMYMDATNFNEEGYALVSDDRCSYYAIDKNFNVVSKNNISGISAYYNSIGDLMCVNQEDGNYKYYQIDFLPSK